MKIQCQSCQAKYTIADEKVLGKVVKIRCKKCSSTIVINGNEAGAADGDAGAFDYAGGSNEPWTVNVADGDQRTMTVAEIAAEYKNGVVNDETYCWKDGMADWLPLREIEPIYGAIKGRSIDEVSVTPQSVPPPAGPLFGDAAAAPEESPFAGSNGNGALFGGGSAEAHAPAAARRAGGRAAGADLFGNVEKAGGEDDVMTSAAASGGGGGGGGGGGAAAAAAEEKLTGQRNENSVLFSLSALTDKPADKPTGNRTTATSDGSGLIDIRALSANMDEGEKKKDAGARVDDIMNLSGGGAFGAALAAPILAPPPLEPVDMGVSASSPPKQNKTLMFAILGGCAFLAIAAIAIAVITTRAPATPDTTKTGAATGTATTEPTGAPTTADPTGTPPTTTTTTAAADNTPPPPGTGVGMAKPGAVPAKPGTIAKPVDHGGAVAANTGAATPPPAPAPAPAPPKDFNTVLGEAAGQPKAAATGNAGAASTAPFDRGAAQAALGAVNVSSCKKADGPTGQGHVTITFGPDGQVQTAVVDQGPFPGTAVGGCVASKFRGAHVPPFGGAPVRVGKSFSIN